MDIKETTTIKNILTSYPEVFHVFVSNGFRYPSIGDFVDAVGETTMLKTILNLRGINRDLFIKQLENEIQLTKNEKSYLLDDVNLGDKVDFFGNIIFTVKITLKEELEKIVKSQTEETFKCFVKSGKKAKKFSESLKTDMEIEDFPSVMITKEFKEHLGKGFRERLLDKGYFKGDFHENINSCFLESGIIDPKGDYCVYSVIPVVFLVDMDLLGDLPIPKTNGDLLNPVYKDNIIVFGKGKETITSPAFFYIYKEFGEEGIRKLAYNVKNSVKSAEMAKVVCRKGKESAPIYVMPWFFAKTCYAKNLKIIWPEDGAMTLPMYMIVKKDSVDKVRPLINYIIGEDFGNVCAKANMPSVNGNVNSPLPNRAKLKWLGWDYIRENDVVSIEEKCEEIFIKEWIKFHPEGGVKICK